MKRLHGVFVVAVLAMLAGTASADISEGFEAITALAPPDIDGTVTASGFEGALRSDPLGSTGIFQGNADVFPAHAGSPASYAGLNFNNSGSPGSISSWLMTPEQTLQNGDSWSFYTRTGTGSAFADALEVRLSTSGASTDVGVGAGDVGDFSTLLLEINTALAVGGYPEDWTEFSGTISGMSGGETGRIGLRYVVSDAGPLGDNSNYIGIDTVEYTAIPEPATFGLLCVAAMALIGVVRRK